MSDYLDKATDKIYELYKIYEIYAWNHKNVKIVISLGKDNNISFYIFENDELIDNLRLSFEENSLFKSLSLRLFVKTLGNVKIHRLGKEMYYNPVHKRYLLFIVNNIELSELIQEICHIQEERILNFDTEIIKNIDNKTRKRIYSKQFLLELDKRIDITREIFRKW